jgi:hypothetical protein
MIHYPTRYTGTELFKSAISLLKRRASNRATIGYGPLFDLLKLRPGHHARREAGQLLGEISYHTHSDGKPMLSALVVDQTTKRPGPGFYECAIHLGKLPADATEEEKERFWRLELNQVYRTAW